MPQNQHHRRHLSQLVRLNLEIATMFIPPRQSPPKTAKTLITIQKKSSTIPSTPVGVLHNFAAMAKVLNLQVIEMWIQDVHSFDLVEHYVSESLPKEYVERVSNYHCGALENNTSRSLCKQALKSNTNYYWISKQDRRLHSEMKFHTALSFRIPQGELFSCDIFVVAYAINFITFMESKMNYVVLMSYGAALAMYSPTLYHVDARDTNTESGDSADNNKISCAPMQDGKPIQIRLLQDEKLVSCRSVISALSETVVLSSVSCSDLGDAIGASSEGRGETNVFDDDRIENNREVHGSNRQFQQKRTDVVPPAAHAYQPELGRKDYVDRTMTQFMSVLKVPMNDGGKTTGGNIKPKVTNSAAMFRSSILDNLLFPSATPVTGESPSRATSSEPPPAPPLTAPPPSTTTKASPPAAVTFAHLQSAPPKAKTTAMTPDQKGLRDMESGSVVSGGSSFQFVSVQNLFLK